MGTPRPRRWGASFLFFPPVLAVAVLAGPVDASLPLPGGCGAGFNVKKDASQDYTTIQAAVDGLAKTLTSDTCIVIRDTQTYAEQVTVQGFTNNGWRLKIMADPSFVSSAPVVSPPALSTAAFFIQNASVTLQGLRVYGADESYYGIRASSDYVTLSGVAVEGLGGNIKTGVSLRSFSGLYDSSVTVRSPGAFSMGVELEGSSSTVAYSTVSCTSANTEYWGSLRIQGGNGNSVIGSVIENSAGTALTVGSDHNLISGSTVRAKLPGESSVESAVMMAGGSYNTVTGSLIASVTGIGIDFGAPDAGHIARYNVVSHSTITSDSSDYDDPAVLMVYGQRNTITDSYVSCSNGNAVNIFFSDGNTISRSTISANRADGFATLNLSNASDNVFTDDVITNPAGYAVFLDWVADRNAFTGGRITSNGSAWTGDPRASGNGAVVLYGMDSGNKFSDAFISDPSGYGVLHFWDGEHPTSSATYRGNRIEGASPVYLSGSDYTVLDSNVLVVLDPSGKGVELGPPSTGLSMSSNTILSGMGAGTSYYAGVSFGEGDAGELSLGSTTLRGARYGLSVATPAAGASLWVSSMSFQSLAPASTGVQFLGGPWVSTFSGVDFADSAMAANVDGRLLGAGSRVTLRSAKGPKAGPRYESDPGGYVDWPDNTVAVPGCGLSRAVNKDGTGEYLTIQSAVDSLPASLSTTTCVVIRDSVTYNEQVTVRRFTNNGYRLKIMADPSLASAAPTVSPPAASTAAFFIANDSVSLRGFSIIPAAAMPYGILASSKSVDISSVVVRDDAGLIGAAGVSLTTGAVVSASTVSVRGAKGLLVQGKGAAIQAYAYSASGTGLFLSRATGASIVGSTIAVDGSGDAVYFDFSSSNTFMGGVIRSTHGHAVNLNYSDHNELSGLSAAGFAADGAVYLNYSPYNSIERSIMRNTRADWGNGLYLESSHWNTVSESTMTGLDGARLHYSDNNSIDRSSIDGHYALYLGLSGSNRITRSTVTSTWVAFYTYMAGSNVFEDCTIAGGLGAAHFDADSSGNVVRRSTLTATSGSGAAFVHTAGGNIVEQSYAYGNWGVSFGGSAESGNALRDSTIVGGTGGIYAEWADSEVVDRCVVRGPTALLITGGSTGITVTSSTLTGTGDGGMGLNMTGSSGLSLTSSTVSAGPLGTGISLGPGAGGSLILSSVTVDGGLYGLTMDSLAEGSAFDISSFSFRGAGPDSVPVYFAGGRLVLTLRDFDFSGSTLAHNVQGDALEPGSRITMAEASGPMAGPAYESDPNQVVDWPGYADPPRPAFPAPAGCGLVENVLRSGGADFLGIQHAIEFLKDFHDPLTSDACVVIRDTQTYAEQVVLRDLEPAGHRFSILSDPSFTSSAPVVSPPALSSAAFVVEVPSVSLSGLDIVPAASLPYGIVASSTGLSLSRIGLERGTASFTSAGILLSGEAYRSTFTRVRFDQPDLPYAVDAGGLAAGSRITLREASGPAAGPSFSRDPAGILEWPDFVPPASAHDAAPPGCATTRNVRRAGGADFTRIQDAVDALSAGGPLGGNACIVVSDALIYPEQVVVQGVSFVHSTNTLTLEADPALDGSAPTISPPAGSTAAFVVRAAGIALQGFLIRPGGRTAYGVLASSPGVRILDTVVGDASGLLSGAGIALSSSAVVARSRVSTPNVPALTIEGAGSEVSYSTFQVQSESARALQLEGSSYDTVRYCVIENPLGSGVLLRDSSYDELSGDLIRSAGYGVEMYGSERDLIDRLTILNAWTSDSAPTPVAAVGMFDDSTGNTISRSVLTGDVEALEMTRSPGNVIADSRLSGEWASYAVSLWDSPGTVLASSTVSGYGGVVLQGDMAGSVLSHDAISVPSVGIRFESAAGGASVSDVEISGAAVGLGVAGWSTGELAASSITFRDLSGGNGTAISFESSSLVSTLTGMRFADASIGVNVDGSGLGEGSRVTLRESAGPRRGPAFENDPYGRVDWVLGKPRPPSGLSAGPLGGGRIALAWSPSPDPEIAQYRVYCDSGTGAVAYGAPIAVLPPSATSWATGVLASSPSYTFGLRAYALFGLEEDNVSVLASAPAVETLDGVKAVVTTPAAGKRVRGNRVTVMARIAYGAEAQVRDVSLQFKPSASASWSDIPAADAAHPNPDASAPYFIHWDATSLASGSYDLRAVATDILGTTDAAPSAVTVVVDPVDADIVESARSDGTVLKQEKVDNAVTSRLQATDATGAGVTQLELPAGCLAASAVTVSVVNDPPNAPPAPTGLKGTGVVAEIALDAGLTQLAPGRTATVGLSYPDADGDGVLDGTDIRVENLQMYSASTAAGPWQSDLVSTVDPVTKTVKGQTSHFSFFALFAKPLAADLSAVRVYPIPYMPNGGDPDQGRPYSAGDPDSGIVFDNIPGSVSIKIYTITGQVVAEMSTDNSNGRVQWDVRNGDGSKVATGGYLAVISSPGRGKVVKRLLIVR